MSVVLVVALSACEDTSTPPYPAPPPQIKTQTSYTTGTGLPSADVYDILVTSAGELWIATDNGIAVYPDVSSTQRKGDVINELNGLPNRIVRRMVEYNGHIYVGTWGGGVGIYNMATENWAVRSTAQGLIDDHVGDIAVYAPQDSVFFATTNGVCSYSPTSGQFRKFGLSGLLDPVVTAVEIKDDGGGVFERWYGPRFDAFLPPADYSKHGITVVRGSSISHYSLATSDLPEARVNDIYYDDVRGTFWVAMASTGLAEVNVPNSTWTIYTTANGLPSNTVFRVTRANDVVWAATQAGLARLKSGGTWQGYGTSGGLQGDRVRVVYSDDGQRLWLGFVNGGAARVSPGSAQ